SPANSEPAFSAGDTDHAGDEDTLDLHLFAEDDEVGGGVDLDAAGVRPDHTGGHRGGGVERRLQGDAEAVQVANGVDHRQDAAGEDAVVAPDDAVADLDGDVAEPVGAVAGDA